MPYRKPLDTPQYIHRQSNHPASVLKQVPLGVEKRLNDISSSKEIFENAKSDYEKALKNSGFKQKLKWSESTQSNPKAKRRRRRDEIWFNPPFNKSLVTNIGKQFLNLVNKNFPSTSPLSKVLNRKTIKVSFACTENMANKIKKHNKKLLTDEQPQEENDDLCNCRIPANCPVEGKCKTESVVYKAKVTYQNSEMEYVGLTDLAFKTRYNELCNLHDLWEPVRIVSGTSPSSAGGRPTSDFDSSLSPHQKLPPKWMKPFDWLCNDIFLLISCIDWSREL